MIVGDTVILKNKPTKHKITRIEGSFIQVDFKSKWYPMNKATLINEYQMGDKVKFKFEDQILVGIVSLHNESLRIYGLETEDEIYSVPYSCMVEKYNEKIDVYKSLLKEMVE